MTVGIDLLGKTALITGATRGIGKAIADAFMDCGADLMLTGTKPEEIEQMNAEEKNPKVQWLKADFSSPDEITSFIEQLKSTDAIDICVNNAGINIIKPYEEYSADEYQRLMSINLTAPFSLTQQLIPGMKKRGFGRIVNIASIWSEISKPGRSLYTTSKTGLVGLTRSLAVEHASSNILVNAVSPGFTRTELTEESLSTDEIKTLSEQIPVGRFAEPNEIAQTVLFLCSDLNTYITGQNIVVDGGFTLV
jgi:3-oxoacyl-[acyl-carrier protein] reductase|tara:strand:+ start:34 stop:783 length:750 start_codon:yes stop_codon:yes gene_type:complete